MAHCEDLNLQHGTLFVRHPKGEGSWASAEPVDIIRPDMLPLINRYLFERQEYLKNQGMRKVTALFPNLYRGQDDFYSANAFNEIKHLVEEMSGIEFKLKDFRSTLTTMTVNGDLSRLPAMSAQLRHTNLATTQRSRTSVCSRASPESSSRTLGKNIRSSFPKTLLLRKILIILDMYRSGPIPFSSS